MKKMTKKMLNTFNACSPRVLDIAGFYRSQGTNHVECFEGEGWYVVFGYDKEDNPLWSMYETVHDGLAQYATVI